MDKRSASFVETLFSATWAKALYNAVPFVGTVNRFISLPSSSRRAFFRIIPPPYPVRFPDDPTTRWMSETAKVCIVCHCYRESDTVIRIIPARQATREEEERYVRGI
jgi:hypothetical protein